MAVQADSRRLGSEQRDITHGLQQRPDLAFSQAELQCFAAAHGGESESFSDVETTGRNAQESAITQFSSAKPVLQPDGSFAMQLLDLFILPYRPIYQEYLNAKARHEQDPKNNPAPVYDRRLYEYQIDSEALAVTGTRFIREAGENSPIIGMVLEPRDPKTGTILERIAIEHPLQSFAEALPQIQNFINAKHDLYYNAPFDKAFLRQKTLDVMAYEQFCAQRTADNLTPESIASTIAENKAKLSDEPTLFAPDARNWQCLFYNALVADSGHPANRLDDTFRRMVDPDFTERKAHDAAEDIAMSAKVATALHEQFSGDIPDFLGLWKKLIAPHCPEALVEAETYNKAPFETRKHFDSGALKPFGDEFPCIHIHLPPSEDAAPLSRFFDDMMEAKARNANTIGFVLDCQHNESGTDIWLNPASRDNKPLIAGLIRKFQLFADAALAPKSERIVDTVRLYDSVSKCDVQLQGTDKVINNVPLTSLHHNLAFLSNPDFSIERREQLIKMIAEICKHKLISNAFIETDKQGQHTVVLKGTIPHSGDIRFALGQIDNPLDVAPDILTYMDKMAKVGLLEGTEEAIYRFDDDDEDAEVSPEAEADDAKRTAGEIDLNVEADKAGKVGAFSPLHLSLSPTVSALVKRQLGERINAYKNVATDGRLDETELGTLVFDGNLSNVDRWVKTQETPNEIRFDAVLRNASWLNCRLKKVADVNEVVAQGDSIVLRCHSGISQRTLFTLHRAAIPFSITADAQGKFTEITLNQDSLFRDAFNASKQLKEATSDINAFYAQDITKLPNDADSMPRKKYVYFSKYQPDMAMLADTLHFGHFSELRANQKGDVYFKTVSEQIEHRFIPLGQKERLKLVAPDGRVDAAESSVMDPYVPIRIDVAEDFARIVFTKPTPLLRWMKIWLLQHQIDVVPESNAQEIILKNKGDLAATSEGLATLVQHYYRLYRHSGSLPLVHDTITEIPNQRDLLLDKASFPSRGERIHPISKGINKLRVSLETIKEHINNLSDLAANFVTQMGEVPVLNDDHLRLAAPLHVIERKLAPRKERIQNLDKLSEQLDASQGCQHLIDEHLQLQKEAPERTQSPLKDQILWLSQLSDAARLSGCSEPQIESIDTILATLTRAHNSAERLHEAAVKLHAMSVDPTNGLVQLYCSAALLELPDAIASGFKNNKKPEHIIGKLRTVLGRTHHKKRNTKENEKALDQTINHSIADHLLFWGSSENQQAWQQRHPEVTWQEVATVLLTKAHQPALKKETAHSLVRLCCEASTMADALKQQEALLSKASGNDKETLENPPFGDKFFNALLIVRGLTSYEEMGESYLSTLMENVGREVQSASAKRAKQYGVLIDDMTRRKDALSLESDIQQLRLVASHLWQRSGQDEPKPRKSKKSFSDSTVSDAKFMAKTLKDNPSLWQSDPEKYIECEGAEELLFEQLVTKAERKAQRYIQSISNTIPDPYRELKLARRIVRKHGDMHQGFIKEWNDFDYIMNHTLKHLQSAFLLLEEYSDRTLDSYASFQGACEHIQQHYAESIRGMLTSDDLPFEKDHGAMRWTIDLSPLLDPTYVKPQPKEILMHAPEPTGWEEGWGKDFSPTGSIADVPEFSPDLLKPFQPIFAAYMNYGEVTIEEIKFKAKAHDPSGEMILEAVEAEFNKIVNPMARKMGHVNMPEVSYDANTRTLRICFAPQHADLIVKKTHDAASTHQLLTEMPRTQVEEPKLMFRSVRGEALRA